MAPTTEMNIDHPASIIVFADCAGYAEGPRRQRKPPMRSSSPPDKKMPTPIEDRTRCRSYCFARLAIVLIGCPEAT
ncbi:hypothetical protein RFM41_14690 [Mesorhizobium sp. VK25A]|uniref:hypothetical protein n=1 Tax=Mesorhizobium vachelliae TaxID=3072309 RepID=UPI002A2474D2|nr:MULTISPECIES: hypothetical protein [unclassified Mesorhizobium]MDX8544993.1 hypothetical protein [Mesorhizobium sp. VK25A]